MAGSRESSGVGSRESGVGGGAGRGREELVVGRRRADASHGQAWTLGHFGGPRVGSAGVCLPRPDRLRVRPPPPPACFPPSLSTTSSSSPVAPSRFDDSLLLRLGSSRAGDGQDRRTSACPRPSAPLRPQRHHRLGSQVSTSALSFNSTRSYLLGPTSSSSICPPSAVSPASILLLTIVMPRDRAASRPQCCTQKSRRRRPGG